MITENYILDMELNREILFRKFAMNDGNKFIHNIKMFQNSTNENVRNKCNIILREYSIWEDIQSNVKCIVC
jgi:hypothetical protein